MTSHYVYYDIKSRDQTAIPKDLYSVNLIVRPQGLSPFLVLWYYTVRTQNALSPCESDNYIGNRIVCIWDFYYRISSQFEKGNFWKHSVKEIKQHKLFRFHFFSIFGKSVWLSNYRNIVQMDCWYAPSSNHRKRYHWVFAKTEMMFSIRMCVLNLFTKIARKTKWTV